MKKTMISLFLASLIPAFGLAQVQTALPAVSNLQAGVSAVGAIGTLASPVLPQASLALPAGLSQGRTLPGVTALPSVQPVLPGVAAARPVALPAPVTQAVPSRVMPKREVASASMLQGMERLGEVRESMEKSLGSGDTMRAADISRKTFDNGAPQGATAVEEPSEPGHDLGNVTGTDISMKVYDHAIAGAIKNFVAWGVFEESKGASTLVMRRYGQTISAVFKKQEDGTFGGVISSGEGETARKTTVQLAGVDPKDKTFTLRLNGKDVVVSITAEGFSGGHFVNPTYSTVIDGKNVSYRMEVECCFGYSIQMAMMILGAYVH
jgi:hypothetical protein